MVITHEDDERVDVLVPKREGVLDVCKFVHQSGPGVYYVLWFILALMGVRELKVSVLRRETCGQRVREFWVLA